MAKPKSLPYEAPEDAQAYSVALGYSEGGSDKVYQIAIEPAGPDWIVNYANGRRGGTLATGTKTKTPVPYAEARKIGNSLLFEKVGKGYLPTAGSRFEQGMTAEAIATIAKASSGHTPQLANAVEIDNLDNLIADRRYVAQEKHDGERRLLIAAGGTITGGNRQGQTVALPAGIAMAASSLTDTVLDGEQIGDVFYAFDILRHDETLTHLPLVERLQILNDVLPVSASLRMSAAAFTPEEKSDLIDRVRSNGGEGVVFKVADAPYTPGRPASGGAWRKLKFWNSLSAVVARTNAQRSVALELLDGDGSRVPVGNVTVPANHAVPEAGDVVEIRYLYAYDGGSLYQPIYLGPRTDIEVAECLASQRMFKAVPDPIDLGAETLSKEPTMQRTMP